MSWKDKVKGFLTSKHVEHEVNGQTLRFYPLPGRILFRLKTLGGPISNAIATLLEKGDKDAGQIHREFGEGKDGSAPGSETQILPISAELASLRLSSNRSAVQSIVSCLTDNDAKAIVGHVITSSLRDIFDPGMSDQEVCEFMDHEDMGLPTIVAMLTGAAKANKAVFGPLGGQVSEMMKKVTETTLEKIALRLNKVEEEEESTEPEETESP